MTDSRKGYVRMRTLQAVVLLIFGVIILRLAYIQLIDPKYEKLARAATRCGTSSNTRRAEKSSTATASTWRRTAPATT